MAEYVSLAVPDSTTMRVYVARPGTPKPRRGMLVFQEAFGVNQHIRAVADRLAALGYLAAAPELYHRTAPGFEGDYEDFRGVMEHLRALTAAGEDGDIRAAHAWLAQQGVEWTGAVGFCMGGRVAARAAATVPLAVAASFYGGDLLSLRNHVPEIAAPLLLVWGDRDTHIPVAQRAEFADLLRAEGKPFVECTFSEAGHGFFCDQRSSYHAASAHLAWGLLTSFLAPVAD